MFFTVPMGALTFETPAGPPGAPGAAGAFGVSGGNARVAPPGSAMPSAGAMRSRGGPPGAGRGMPAGPRKAMVKVVAEDGTQRDQEVTVGVTSRVSAEIITGLKVGDKVVAGHNPARTCSARRWSPATGRQQLPVPAILMNSPTLTADGNSMAPERSERPASSELAIPLIEMRDIRRTFVTGGGVEVNALRGINLKIYPGEFVAIVGQSGSGKSTLMNLLGCLDRPTSASICLPAGTSKVSMPMARLAAPRSVRFRVPELQPAGQARRRKRTSKSQPFTPDCRIEEREAARPKRC